MDDQLILIGFIFKSTYEYEDDGFCHIWVRVNANVSSVYDTMREVINRNKHIIEYDNDSDKDDLCDIVEAIMKDSGYDWYYHISLPVLINGVIAFHV